METVKTGWHKFAYGLRRGVRREYLNLRRRIALFLSFTLLLFYFPSVPVGTAVVPGGSGGDYSLNFAAADTKLYEKYSPSSTPPGDPTLKGDPGANWMDSSGTITKVESLMPPKMKLGQIVVFLTKVSVNAGAVQNGTITLEEEWLAKTTNGGDFGFDPSYGVYYAFVDTNDPAYSGDKDENVSYSWRMLEPNTKNERIKGTFTVSGVDPLEELVLEVWMVLDDSISPRINGNVQTGLMHAWYGDANNRLGCINTGTQTVPLLKVEEFLLQADISVTKSDSPDPVRQGDQLIYTVTVANNSKDIAAENVTVTDTLDSNVTYVSDTCTRDSNGPSVSGRTYTWQIGSLSPGETYTFNIKASVSQSAPVGTETLLNVVDVSSTTDDSDLTNNHDEEPTSVETIHPELTVTKTANLTLIHSGDSVEYTITVENTGDDPITNITLDDDKYPGIDALTTGFDLGVGGSKTFTYTTSVAADVTNTVMATGKDSFGRDVSASDSASVDVINPEISIDKRVDKSSIYPGDTVTYTFEVTNTGDTGLSSCYLTDTVFNAAMFVSTDGSDPQSFTLGVGKSKVFTYTTTLNDTTHNVATVYGTDQLGKTVSASDSADVTVIPFASIVGTVWEDMDKDGNKEQPGEPGIPNVTVTLYDSQMQVVATTTTDTNGDYSFPNLIPGQYTVMETDPAGYQSSTPNVANLILSPGQEARVDFGDYRQATIGDTVFEDLNRSGSQDPGEPGIQGVTVALKKGGSTVDTKTTNSTGYYDFSVDPGTYVVDVTDSGNVLDGYILTTGNDPTASITVKSGDDYNDADFGYFKIISSIDIEKTASETTVYSGDPVTFAYTVTNTSNSDLTNIYVFDTDFDVNLVVAQPFNLAKGESKTFSFGPVPINADHVNIATVYGTDELGKQVTDSDDASVNVINPALKVTKTADPTIIYSGDEVTYTIVVKNTGDDPITGITLDDDQYAGIDALTTGFDLGVGESKSFTYTTSVEADITNTVTATGKDSKDGDVTDSDDASVNVINPALKVTKDVDKDIIYKGETVTFTAMVENIGDDPLTNLTLDDNTGLVFNYVSGDNGNGVLDIGETWAYEVSASIFADYTNTVTATGYDSLKNDVSDSDDASVNVINPALKVTKTADSTIIYSGDKVTYTIVVKNTGDDPITGITLDDDKYAGIDNLEGQPFDLEPDQSKSFTYTTSVEADITNTVTATGKDSKDGDVTDSDDASVNVINPALKVTKTADSTIIYSGDKVTYTIVVKNTGDDPITGITLDDDKYAGIDNLEGQPFDLEPDQSKSFTYTTSVAADITNTVTATGYDSLENPVTDSDDAFVDVLPFGSIGDTVFNDLNNNGVQDSGEPGIEGVTLILKDDKGSPVPDVSPQTTDENGYYLFENLRMGGYIVDVDDTTVPEGYVLTTNNDPTLDILLVLLTQENYLEADFGYYLPPPDLEIQKSADPTTADPGDTVTYTLTYRNIGDGDAHNVTIIDDYDQRYITQITDISGGGTESDGKITWDVGTVPAHSETYTLTYKATISESMPNGTTNVDNVVVITTTDDETNEDNNRDDARVIATVPFLPFLPYTGLKLWLLALIALALLGAGIVLQRIGRKPQKERH